MPPQHTVHVLNNTHWDREWQYPFETYKVKFAKYTDKLLDIFRNSDDLKHYHFDGQYICVEDYLSDYPERMEEITALVRSNKLLIGPWYTLPDMNLVSGEAIIRNLLTGIRGAGELGGSMLEGYTACSNGQISQLPQIYKGFDIDSAIIYKGLRSAEMPREFIWESPNGEQVFAVQLANRYGRANFFTLIMHSVAWGVIHDTKNGGNWEYTVDQGGLPFRIDRPGFGNPYIYEMLSPEEGIHEEHVANYVQKLVALYRQGSASSHILGFNGFDHSMPNAITADVIEACNRADLPVTFIDSTIPEAIKAIREELKATPLKVHRGEFRSPKVTADDRDLYDPTLSYQMNVKTENRKIEHYLADVCEPLAVMDWLRGGKYPSVQLGKAWKLLLANHGHDSIDACSVNKVVGDMFSRYGACQALSESMIGNAVASLLKLELVEDLSFETSTAGIAVANPSLYKRDVAVEMNIDLPKEVDPKALQLEDYHGETIGAQFRFASKEQGFAFNNNFQRTFILYRYTLAFTAADIPPLSLKHFTIVVAESCNSAVPVLISREDNSLENQSIKVSVNKNGTVNLLNKRTGRLFKGLNYFRDSGENGDPWKHVPVDPVVDSLNSTANITLLENGPEKATLLVQVEMEIPASLENRRVNNRVALISELSLFRSEDYLRIRTEVVNTCRDHKLEICFPTGMQTEMTYAGAPFDLIERPVKLPDMANWMEKINGYPNYGFFGMENGQEGLAVLNMGLPEYVVDQQDRGTLRMTLIRATNLKNWTNDERNDQVNHGQCLGRNEFHYAVYPYEGSCQDVNIWQVYRRFSTPGVHVQYFGAAVSRSSHSLLSLNNAKIETSAVKLSENGKGVVIRLWNPLEEKQTCAINCGFTVGRVAYVNFNERELDDKLINLSLTGSQMSFELASKTVISLLIEGIKE